MSLDETIPSDMAINGSTAPSVFPELQAQQSEIDPIDNNEAPQSAIESLETKEHRLEQSDLEQFERTVQQSSDSISIDEINEKDQANSHQPLDSIDLELNDKTVPKALPTLEGFGYEEESEKTITEKPKVMPKSTIAANEPINQLPQLATLDEDDSEVTIRVEPTKELKDELEATVKVVPDEES